MMALNTKIGGIAAAGLMMVLLCVMPVRSAETVKPSKPIRTFKVPVSDKVSMAPSPDDKLIAVASVGPFDKAPLTVWNLDTGEQVAGLRDKKNRFRTCRAVAFSPDSRLLAAVSENDREGLVRVWDTSTWRIVRRLKPVDSAGGSAIAFSPDGQLLAISYRRDPHISAGRSSIHLWDIGSGKVKTILNTTGSAANDIIFASDANHMACCNRKRIYIWDLQTFSRQTIQAKKDEYFVLVSFSPDGKSLVTREGNHLRVFESTTGQEEKQLRLCPDELTVDNILTVNSGIAVAPLAKSSRMAVISGAGGKLSVMLFDLKKARDVGTISHYRLVGVGNSDPLMEASASGEMLYLLTGNALDVWPIPELTKE